MAFRLTRWKMEARHDGARRNRAVVDAAPWVAIRAALEAAGLEFIDANGGGAGERFRDHSDGAS